MTIEQDRVISTATQRDEEVYDRAVRPKTLADYVGQPAMKAQMEIFIQAARKRGESLDHVLIFGPPGLGKTTLAHVIANELGVGFKQTSGPVLERPGDLAALLTNLQPNELLFVDEIHRLSPVVEEILYPALEDFQLDIMIGEGPGRALDQDRPAAVHAGRRDDARGPAHLAVARSLRHRAAPRVLRRTTTSSASCNARPGFSACRWTKAAPSRSRRARAARRASPIGCCDACAISPRSKATAASRTTSRGPRSTCSTSIRRASTRWTAG